MSADVPAEGSDNIGRELIRRTAEARTSVALVCPYLTNAAFVDAVRASSATTKRLVTRLDRGDVLSGATDLRRVIDLVDAGVVVRILEGVHAKVYLIDEWAYVGSANLTRTGLADGLREFGRAGPGEHAEVASAYFDAVWGEGSDVTREQLQSVLDQLPALRAEAEALRARVEENAKRLVLPHLPKPRRPASSTASPREPSEGELELISWCGGRASAAAVARIIAAAIRSVPSFATSEHWTLNRVWKNSDHLRLSVGKVEVITVKDGELHCASRLRTLTPDDLAQLEAAGASVYQSPYSTLVERASDAIRVSVSPARAVELEPILTNGLLALQELDQTTGRSQHRGAYSRHAVRAVGVLADDTELMALGAEHHPPGAVV